MSLLSFALRPSVHTTCRLVPLIVMVVLFTTVGCASDPGSSAIDIGVAPFDAGLDANILDAGLIDGGKGLDSGSTDVAAGPDGAAGTDVLGADDTAKDVINIGCPGAPGCSCKDNDECDNGLCNEDPTVASVYGKVCASKCVDTCKTGYSCVQTTGAGGDAISLCVPSWGRVCNPCSESKECKSLGVPGMACVNYGDAGGFCGSPCAKDGDCDAGYHCGDSTNSEGAKAKWCMRSPAIKGAVGFGVCPCSPSATKSQLSTTCFVTYKDKSGAVTGKCAGTRRCELVGQSAGLNACTAPALSAEVCDGKDNDCDGDTDEETCDDKDACTVDSCDQKTQKCVFAAVKEGVACDADGSICTENDSCKGGKCTAGTSLNCDDKNPCSKDSCDAKTGCVQVAANGTPCDDDNPCTIGDVCKDKSCDAGSPKKCTSTDPCVLASCSLSKNGKCQFKDAIDGLPCDDGNACSEKDACKGGSCTAGKIADCDDGNPCTTDSCDKDKGCLHLNHTKPCGKDGDPCTVGAKCAAGKCVGGALKSCDDSNPCTVDSCNKATGKCLFDGNKALGASCTDGNVCTESDACKNGACTGVAKSCDDGNPCTTATCKSGAGGGGSGCVQVDKSGACDDGNSCTKSDVCTKGKCTGVGKSCDDGNPCTTDSCDAKQDCTHKARTGPCTDGDACTEKDACKSGVCTGKTLSCDDGNPCTTDSCNKQSGCVFVANTKSCVDADKCTEKEVCSNKVCKKASKTCDDGNPCTKDSCNPVTGCVFTKTTGACDDGNSCTVKDTCTAGKCGGIGKSCDDNNPCTKDACDAQGKCINSALTGACNDGDACTKNDACKNGSCTGNKQNCDDGNMCTTDSCSSSGGCVFTANTAKCTDANACTVNEVCSNKVCKKTTKNCNDNNPCTVDSCDVSSGCKAVKQADKTSCKADGSLWCMAGTCVKKTVVSKPPTINFIKPSGDFNGTQGQSIGVILDATAVAGTSISTVQLLVNGAVVMTDTSLPYGFNWVIPKTAKTGSVLTLQARATDKKGAVGVTKVLKVVVKNDKPLAAFTATVVGKLQVAVDGSLSKDTETPTAKLLVRFDWTNDGSYDTAWNTKKTLTQSYKKAGTYTIAMQVKDEDGQVTTTTRSVSMSLITQVGGTIKTTTWSGTIIITGDIIVPKGEVLTISPGTSVLFVPVDQDKNKIGDFDIWVYGKLKVQGTANAPVTISTYGAKKTPGRDWGRIQLKGEGSSIAHAVIEYGQYGIELMDTSTVSNVTLRALQTGLRIVNGNATVKDVTASTNLVDGFSLTGSGKLMATGITLENNGRFGLWQDTSSTSAKLYVKDALITKNKRAGLWARSTTSNMSFTLTDSQVKSNGGTGVTLVGGIGGLVTRNQLLYNNEEGLRAVPYKAYDVRAKINYNNIYGNALVAAWQYSSKKLSVKKSGSGSGAATSSSWLAPNNGVITMVKVGYAEYDYQNRYMTGYLRKSSSSGIVLVSLTSTSATQWHDVSPFGATRVVAQVKKNTYSGSYYGTMTFYAAASLQPGLKREVTFITHNKLIDAKHNYLGTFPNVLSVVTRSSSSSVDLHGFIGVPFDSTWKKGPYWGGNLLTSDTTWSGKMWVTGHVVVAKGKTLTIASGTNVQMVRYDAAGDGRGDFKLDIQGSLLVKGTQSSPVVIKTFGTKKTAGRDWDRISLRGSGSRIDYAEISYGRAALEVFDKTPINNTTVTLNEVGLTVRSPASAIVTGLLTTKNLIDGVHVASGGKVTLNKLTATANGRHGVYVQSASSSTYVAIKASTLSQNKGDGLKVASTTSTMTLSLRDSFVKSNAWAGVYLHGGISGDITQNQLLYNGYEGFRAAPYRAYDVRVKVNYNNIFGNSLTGAWQYQSKSLTVKKSGSGSGSATSLAWTAPGGSFFEHIKTSYSEYDYQNRYIKGYVRKDSGSGTVMITQSTSAAAAWYDVSGAKVKKFVVQINKNTYSGSYYGTQTVLAAVWLQLGIKREVSVITQSKTVDLRHNYLGTFPDVMKVVTFSSGSSGNLHGFVGKAYDTTWKKGPYFGGDSLKSSLTWSGEVWITGDYVVPVGKTLTVAAGTQVHVVRFHPTSTTTGELDLVINGVLQVQGTAQKLVVFSEMGGNKRPFSWSGISLIGSSSKSTIAYATIAYANVALRYGSGVHVLKNVTVSSNKSSGILASSAKYVKANQITSKSNGQSGVEVVSSSGVNFDGLTATANGAHGVYVRKSTSGITFKNVTATDNTGAGFKSETATVAFSQCTLSGNQMGAWFDGGAAGTLAACNVKFNQAEGIVLSAVALKQPTVKINNNNIFGNGVKEGFAMSSLSVSIKKSGSGSGTASAKAWTTPYYDATKKTRAKVWALRSGYSEYDYQNRYIRGYIREGTSAGAVLVSNTVTTSTRWQTLSNTTATSLVAQVNKNTYSGTYYGTQSIYGAFYRLGGKKVELAAITDSGTVNCTNNFWGGFTGFDKRLVLSRNSAIDFSGFAVLAKNVGPQ